MMIVVFFGKDDNDDDDERVAKKTMNKGRSPKKKNGKMWEFFPTRGPPPSPLFGNDTFV